jgi:hypothetical protein
MLSHRVNVRTSKFWRKPKETKRNFFSKIYQGHIRIWFRSNKNSKISHACVPLKGLAVLTALAELLNWKQGFTKRYRLSWLTISTLMHIWAEMPNSRRWYKAFELYMMWWKSPIASNQNSQITLPCSWISPSHFIQNKLKPSITVKNSAQYIIKRTF